MSTTANGRNQEAALKPELLERLPPHSLEAEQAVLGSLLLNPLLCDEIATELRADDFYSRPHQILYSAILGLHDSGGGVDIKLLAARLKQQEKYDEVGGAAYLAELAQAVPTTAHISSYAHLVREKATLRMLIHASSEILKHAFDPQSEPREVLNKAEERIFAIHDKKHSGEVVTMYDVLLEVFDQLNNRDRAAAGVDTGYTDLDQLTGGLHKSELVILAARPSMGKTALACNIAEYVAVDARKTVLFFSLEMSKHELAQRMLCSRAEVNAHDVRHGRVSAMTHRKLVTASGEIGESPLFIDDSASRTVVEISAAARRLKRKNDLALVIIDYLQLIEPDDPRDPRQEQVARITRRLKVLARELEVPVICLAQLNRQAEVTKDNRPRLSHLRESGAIEQDADVVMFVHREEYYLSARERADLENNPADPDRNILGVAEIILAKQRNGPTGEVKLTWRQEYTRFLNHAYGRVDDRGQPSF